MPRDTAPVSVIVPAYNAEATLGRALASIAAQTLVPAEVVVVDDGSSDATADTARAMQEKMGGAKLIVVTQQNMGAGAARNRAIAEATQPYLAFLDADDEWLPEKLERSMLVMRDGDCLLVAHDYLDTTPGGDVHIDCRQRFEEGTDPYVTLYLKGYIPSISVVTKRDAVIAAGGFDETLRNAQDFDLWLKLLADPKSRFTLFGEALARYHHVDGSIMSHTARRIQCCTTIALRYGSALRSRRQPVLKNVLHRLAIVHAEAARAQPHKKWAHFASGAVSMLSNALALTIGGAAVETGAPHMRERPLHIAFGAGWVFGILALYLWQFKALMGPVLQILGLKS